MPENLHDSCQATSWTVEAGGTKNTFLASFYESKGNNYNYKRPFTVFMSIGTHKKQALIGYMIIPCDTNFQKRFQHVQEYCL